jgi:hypothetical protein
MRYEYKYLVPVEQIDAVRSRILPFTERDPFASRTKDGRYTLYSIYFDTANYEMYQNKADHLANRMKVRLRGYNTGNDATRVFMEIKRKYESPILKNRSDAPFGVVKKLFQGESFDRYEGMISKPDNGRRFMYQVFSRNLRPVVNVIYEREPFLSKVSSLENDFRITFDLNLRGVAYPAIDALFSDAGACYPHPGFFILEVKFNQYCPAWVKPILEELKLYKEPASKYVGCIDVNPMIRIGRRPPSTVHRLPSTVDVY